MASDVVVDIGDMAEIRGVYLLGCRVCGVVDTTKSPLHSGNGYDLCGRDVIIGRILPVAAGTEKRCRFGRPERYVHFIGLFWAIFKRIRGMA